MRSSARRFWSGRSRLQLGLIGSVVFSGAAASAQSHAAAPPLQPTYFREHLVSGVPVAATGTRVGLMIDPGPNRIDPSRLWVHLPDSAARSLCVTINSIDGRYEAEARYDITRTSSGIVSLQVPTRYSRQLQEYRGLELAALAGAAVSCPGPVETWVVAAWQSGSEPEHAVLLLNARERTRVLLPTQSAPQMITCPELPLPNKIAYNRACRLSLPENPRRSRLRIQRADLSRPIPEVALEVQLP